MLNSKEWANLMLVCVAIIIALIVMMTTGCSTCPGSQNLVNPKFYDAIDFMKYDASEHCILSKATAYTSKNPYERKMIINEKDKFLFTMENGSMNYFRLNHYGRYEKLRTMYWDYMRFFNKYSQPVVRYKGQSTFLFIYLKWSGKVHLSGRNLQIVARVLEVDIRLE